MYRPSLLLPSDNYRGNLLDVGLAASGFVFEHVAFWLSGILSWVFSTMHVAYSTWSYVAIPVLFFDVLVCFMGTMRFYKNFNWLLRSERKSRAIDIIAIGGQIGCCIVLILHFCEILPLVAVVICCGAWYFLVVAANCWAKSPYIWLRCHFYEFLTFMLAADVYMKCNNIINWSWTVVLWPAWLLCFSILIVGLLVWYFARNENDVEVDAVLRVFVSGLLIMGFCYLLFLELLAAWLDNRKVLIISWTLPLFVGQVITLVYAIIAAIIYTAQMHVSQPSFALAPLVTPGQQANVPPIMRNMQITLDKVGNNFYRLASGKNVNGSVDESSESTPLRESLLVSRNYQSSAASFPANASVVASSPKCSLDNSQTAEQSDYQPPVSHLEASACSTASLLLLTGDPDGALPSEEITNVHKGKNNLLENQDLEKGPSEHATRGVIDDAELCMICCQLSPDSLFLHCGHGGMCFKCAQTCFRRTGHCPTCRQRIDGVAAFDPGEARDKRQITAHIRDTK